MRLHHVFEDRFVHAHGAAYDARAHIRHIHQFEQALHRAVFAHRPVQHRQHHIECAHILDRDAPAAVPVDEYRHDVVAVAVQFLHHRASRHHADVVLARLTAI